MQLIFRVQKAKEYGRPASTRGELVSTNRGESTRGRSPIEIILKKGKGNDKLVSPDTDQILKTLDKLLKKNKIELESLKSIKLEIDKWAGLTSTRIVSAIGKALSLNL